MEPLCSICSDTGKLSFDIYCKCVNGLFQDQEDRLYGIHPDLMCSCMIRMLKECSDPSEFSMLYEEVYNVGRLTAQSQLEIDMHTGECLIILDNILIAFDELPYSMRANKTGPAYYVCTVDTEEPDTTLDSIEEENAREWQEDFDVSKYDLANKYGFPYEGSGYDSEC